MMERCGSNVGGQFVDVCWSFATVISKHQREVSACTESCCVLVVCAAVVNYLKHPQPEE